VSRSRKFELVSVNMAWLAGDRVFRSIVGVVVLGAVARYLGPSQFGSLNYAISLAAIFSTVASLGFEGIVIRELVKRPDKVPEVLGTAFVMRLGGAVATIGLVAGAAALSTEKELIKPLMLVVSLAFLPQSFEVIDLWFQKNIQSKYTVAAKAVGVLVSAGIKLGLVAAKAPLVVFGATVILDALLNAVALVFIFRRSGQSIGRWRFCGPIARLLLQDSWPLMLSGVLVAFYMRIEQVLVMNKLGEHTAGIYFAAVRVTDVWGFLPGLILASIYPLLAQKRVEDRVAYLPRMQMAFDLVTGLGYVIAVAVSLASPILIRSIYGLRYQDAIPILAVRAWTAPIVFSGTVRAQYFLLERKTIYHIWSALIGIACNIGIALALMPRIGAMGAVLSSMIGYWISGYLTSLMFPSLRECLGLQTKAFLLPFRLRVFLKELGQLR
jgi:PST family polysaccharide transporter